MSTKLQQEYEKDFYAWTLHNVALMRAGKLSQIDVTHIAEELESMGRSDRRELVNRFAILLAHLLKWQFQPERRSNSWKYTIEEQREEVQDLLEDSPSLQHELEQKMERAYQKALLIAATETGLEKNIFPAVCPFSQEQAMDSDFFP